MLRFLRQSSRWFLWFVIVALAGVFALYMGFRGNFQLENDERVLVAVGDRSYDFRDLERVRSSQEAEYRRVLGDSFDPDAARDFLEQNAAGSLLRAALLAEGAENVGLAVGDEEIRAYLRRIPGATRPDGTLDREVLTAHAEREYGSVRRFQEAVRDELLGRKLAQLIAANAVVSDAEAADSVRYREETVQLAVVVLGAGPPAADLEPDAAAVDAILAEPGDRLRKAYDARRDEFDRPEEVHARHILIRASDDDPAAKQKARERIEALRQRIVDGADFVDVAREASEDPGSKDRGGDLGFFARGAMVPAFEQVAFTLEPGVLSEVVESPFGFHLIRVEEKRAAVSLPFEDARAQIARDLAREDAARARARSQAEALADEIRGGKTLVDAARELGVTIQRTDPLHRRPDGYVPGVGPAPDLMAAAFALRPDHPTDPEIHEIPSGGLALVELIERHDPDPQQIAAQLPAERQQLLQERRTALETAWLQRLRREAEDAGALRFNLAALKKQER